MSAIILPDEISERIEKAAALRGLSADTYATALLEASLSADARDFEESCAAIATGLAQGEAGLGIPWEQYLAEQKAAREARRRARGEIA